MVWATPTIVHPRFTLLLKKVSFSLFRLLRHLWKTAKSPMPSTQNVLQAFWWPILTNLAFETWGMAKNSFWYSVIYESYDSAKRITLLLDDFPFHEYNMSAWLIWKKRVVKVVGKSWDAQNDLLLKIKHTFSSLKSTTFYKEVLQKKQWMTVCVIAAYGMNGPETLVKESRTSIQATFK